MYIFNQPTSILDNTMRTFIKMLSTVIHLRVVQKFEWKILTSVSVVKMLITHHDVSPDREPCE